MRRLAISAMALAVLGELYARFMRWPVLTWGATNDEATSRLPGDELLEDVDSIATRAITIDAPAEAVWPWIAQMGPSPRGVRATATGCGRSYCASRTGAPD